MGLFAIIDRITGFFKKRTSPQKPVLEPVWAGNTVFERVESKRGHLKEHAVGKAMPLIPEIREQISMLGPAVLKLAQAEPDKSNQYYKVGLEHQKSFSERMTRIQSKLDALLFSDDFEGLSKDSLTLSELLDDVNQAVLHNRHMYVFFAQNLKDFNMVMKRLLELNTQLANTFMNARKFMAQIDALNALKEKQDVLSKQIQDIEKQSKDLTEKVGIFENEKKALEGKLDAKQIEQLSVDLANAQDEEKKATDWFYSVLEKLEGSFKQYAHGKDPGILAATAERYLNIREDFLKDCLLDSDDLRPLLDALPRKTGDTLIADFQAEKNIRADAFEAAREKRQDLEAHLREQKAPLEKIRFTQTALTDTQTRLGKLSNKIQELSNQKTDLQKKCEASAESLLALTT